MVAASWSFHAFEGASNSIRPHLIVPDGCMDLILKAERDHGSGEMVGRSLFFAGPATRHHVSPVTGNEMYCGIRVRPGWAALLFGIHPPELRDRMEPAEQFSRAMRELEQRVLNSGSTEVALHQMTEHLLTAITEEDITHRQRDLRRRTLPLLQALTMADDKIGIRSLADQFGVSARTLQRDIIEVSGLPPKVLSRVTRLQRPLNLLSQPRNAAKPPNFARIAFECNYADLSHMDRDFREFTGLTPGQYWRLRFPVVSV